MADRPPLSDLVAVHEAVASWYGPGFAGRLTASGTVFDPEELTCAHRTLPFGTPLELVNLDNGMSVRVRVTDRGPFISGRDLDLSRAAASALGFESSGLARLRYRIIEQVSRRNG